MGNSGGVVTKRDGRLRVLIADDHPVYRQGLAEAVKRRLDLELVERRRAGSKRSKTYEGWSRTWRCST